MKEKPKIYYRHGKYNRTLSNETAVFACLYFKYGSEPENIPDNILKSLSTNEKEHIYEGIKNMPNLGLGDFLKIDNVEERRIVLSEYLATDKGKEQLLNMCTELSTERIKKKTWWYDKNAEREVEYEDVYTLYLVDLNKLYASQNNTSMERYGYLLLFKDTSTERNYILWIDLYDVFTLNHKDSIVNKYKQLLTESTDEQKIIAFLKKHARAIDAIAWTITTNVPKEKIRKIIRQGDCILVDADIQSTDELHSGYYHLTRDMYLNLMYKES